MTDEQPDVIIASRLLAEIDDDGRIHISSTRSGETVHITMDDRHAVVLGDHLVRLATLSRLPQWQRSGAAGPPTRDELATALRKVTAELRDACHLLPDELEVALKETGVFDAEALLKRIDGGG